jgi:hypothetical protein
MHELTRGSRASTVNQETVLHRERFKPHFPPAAECACVCVTFSQSESMYRTIASQQTESDTAASVCTPPPPFFHASALIASILAMDLPSYIE